MYNKLSSLLYLSDFFFKLIFFENIVFDLKNHALCNKTSLSLIKDLQLLPY
jgi:hypothetical protein